MSMVSSIKAVLPKRRRGFDRVEAILNTGITLFAERDYATVTMTEIAARSATAIGSLYRFFPTKEALAAAILDRYGTLLIGALDQVVAGVEGMTAAQVADAVVSLMRDLKHERAAALALIGVQKNGSAIRLALQTDMIARLTAILKARSPAPASTSMEAQAWLLLYTLKAIRSLDQDRPDLAAEVEADGRRLIEFYIGRAWSGQSQSGAEDGQAAVRSGL
ncbi:TetR/AcrR family transcriptional regulator [Rhizobium deserti]|nr:TetR/AcrR family transcriptional regulator [Rhizobium deserti]